MASYELKGKIASVSVRKAGAEATAPVKLPVQAPVASSKMSEDIPRPRELSGSTYKVKPPSMTAALYVTINNMVMPDQTELPYEVFINTKDTTHLPWVVAITRLMSAVFRKGGDTQFIVEELKSVFDPQGGYFGEGGWHNSVVAEIGAVIEGHLTKLGLVQPEKREKVPVEVAKNAKICPSCHDRALVLMDGCETCLSCGHSKCG